MNANPQRDARPHLHLVPRPQRTHSLLALWHLLSLDAPTVAAIWTAFIAKTTYIHLPWTSPVSMFLAVWMLYAADRLLDARTSPRVELEPRHHFHQKHRAAFLTGIILCAFALLILIPQLNPAGLRIFALLGVLLATYFFFIHIAAPEAIRLPKELAVGIFFPAAVFIPTVARVPNLRLTLLPEALLFAAVCTLNCLYVYAWEHKPPYDRAHWTTRFAAHHLPLLTILAAVAAASLLIARRSPLAAAALLSAFFLLGLHRFRKQIPATSLRAAADLALLTPLLVPALWR